MSVNLVLRGYSQSQQSSFLKGASKLISSSAFQSSPLKNRCSFISSLDLTPIRFLGFLSRRRVIRSLAVAVMLLSNRSFEYLMFSLSSSSSSEQKGGLPCRNSYMTTPIPYRSASFPAPFRDSMSGDRYTGVPQKLMVFESPKTFSFESPKSVSRMWPSSPMSMLTGFRSRQKMLSLCRCQIARTSSAMQNLVSASVNFSLTARKYEMSPFRQQSSTKYRLLGVWNAQCSFIKKLLSTCFRMLHSETAYFRWCLFRRVRLFSTFMAYYLPLSLFLVRNTFPNAPDPTNLMMSKSENLANFFLTSSWSGPDFLTQFYYFLSQMDSYDQTLDYVEPYFQQLEALPLTVIVLGTGLSRYYFFWEALPLMSSLSLSSLSQNCSFQVLAATIFSFSLNVPQAQLTINRESSASLGTEFWSLLYLTALLMMKHHFSTRCTCLDANTSFLWQSSQKQWYPLREKMLLLSIILQELTTASLVTSMGYKGQSFYDSNLMIVPSAGFRIRKRYCS